ncbi:MAG TPA: glycosyltransferase N-terminal domain-containing protein [Bdellovibrionota bacterium]|nr:glycosyltransferase N-terminal domain-containing protein [Bdellovibrionota bacterium]
MSVRFTFYSRAVRSLSRIALSRLASQQRVNEGDRDFRLLLDLKNRELAERAWFHAASVGELESLWPVITAWAAGEGSSSNASGSKRRELVVSILSESARGHILRLREALKASPAELLYAGYCPAEGHWGRALDCVRPGIFITAKYEAWPDLWGHLARAEIPLVIVGAKARRSLRLVKLACRALGSALPKLTLITALTSDSSALKELFPTADVKLCGEPRWDRVYQRSQAGSDRARRLIAVFENGRRPWGVLGSVWSEDMEVFRGCLSVPKGTLWVVPHRNDPASIAEMETFLREEGLDPLKTSELQSASENRSCILVDEMGFLSELYSAADWAFVGGGFGDGIHSTIEPAIHGIPIAGGPNGAEKFAEIAELRESGQLRIVRNHAELKSWVESRSGVLDSDQKRDRDRWKSEAETRRGASLRVAEVIGLILDAVSGPC